mmetsp:Transcript_37799/g.108976  ORF Transcript_37799/g.108976 Transcript_37799/m.108976 type:complete len:252 (-) Transcript_37799:73-828(-)
MASGYGTLAPQQLDMSPAIQCLNQLDKVEVREKASVIESLTAILGQEVEMANRYQVFADDGREIFYAVEETSFCTRQAKQCCPDCVPWSVTILYTEGGHGERALELKRPCTLTCCCFNRPVAHVIDVATQQPLGSLQDPCACCDLTFSLKDASDQELLYARGGCCQWGMCCPCPCGPCSRVQFPVDDARSGKRVAHLQKQVPNCCKFLFASDVDNYKLDFGGVTDPKEKALLLALSIFVDFRYFSDNKADD